MKVSLLIDHFNNLTSNSTLHFRLIIILLIFKLPQNAIGQSTDQDFREVYKIINSKKAMAINLNPNDSNYTNHISLVNETFQLLDFLYDFMSEEHNLNGKGSFSFSGNETSSGNLYKIGAGVNMDQGVYPYELDFSTNVQTLLNDGVLKENVSDIDISFDFHPYVPSNESRIAKYEARIKELENEHPSDQIGIDNKQYLINKYQKKIENTNNVNGLWLENYLIGKRYSDGYLGIDQRYELGGGFIFSLFSQSMTRTGMNNKADFMRKPSYSFHGNDLIRCITSCAPIHNVLSLSSRETQVLSDTRSRYLVSNQKQYSRVRLSLLLGFYYELEKAIITREIFFNNKDTSITVDFSPTNKFKGEIRPGFVWRPKDKYKFKLYSYFKFPLDRIHDIVREGNLSDDRLDYQIDLQASFDIEIEKNFSINLFYRMLYDRAPSRKFIQQSDQSFVLFSGEKSRRNFGIALNFGF